MPENEQDMTPAEVIEDIRSGDYLLDVEGESAKVKRGAKSLQEKLNRTLRLLSEELYSTETHFVLELIQNADDNDYLPGVAPRLAFRLTDGRLVLVNNEVGFAEKNVRALCDVGKSSKAKKTGYIGEKGIGFKSVFKVSDTPEIHSNGYHFCFDRSNETNLLGYVVPIWCSVPKDAVAGQTTIILPAKQGGSFGPETVVDLDSRLLLFLRQLREINLEHSGGSSSFRREDAEGVSLLSTRRAVSGAEVVEEELRFVRAEVPFRMGDITEEKRPGLDASPVVLAFPVDENGEAAPQSTSQVFAFLPIRQCGFKFSIQADFILSSSREEILTDRPWNKRLRDAIAVAFKHSLERFKQTESLAFSYLKFLPTEAEVVDPFFKPVVPQLIRALSEVESLPSASGSWRRPSELRYGHKPFRELFPPAVATHLFAFDYVDERVQADEDLLSKLGAQPIKYADYVNVFRSHGDWLKSQPLQWRAKFYAVLADMDRKALLSAGLRGVACIPTSGGSLVAPEASAVFYPLSRGRKYGFESELTIVDGELLEEAGKLSSRVAEFFQSLNVKPDDPYELVSSHILPRHANDTWKASENKCLIGHVRYIKDKLSPYLTGAALAGKSESQAIAAIRDGLWFGTKSHEGESWFFARIQNLYLGKEYRPLFCLESLLGEGVERASLVSAEYIVGRSKEPDAEAESWRSFLTQLGVRIAPKLVSTAAGDWMCSPELELLLGSGQSAVRKATLECLDQHWSDYSAHLTVDVRLGRGYSTKETGFAKALRSMKAPTRKRSTVPISQCYYPTPELRELFGERATFLDADLRNSGLLDACGVTHRLDARACIKRLQQLKAEGVDTMPQLHALYRNLERFWDKESSYIKQAFRQESLIRVKGTHPVWALPDEVTWRRSSPFLDSLYPPLEGQYRDFASFFQDKLGVPRSLPTGKRVEALLRLGMLESPEERKREASEIYRRANGDLTPKFGREESISPDWLEKFEVEEVFLNHRGELVANNTGLFANDAPELAALFEDCEEISLLGVSFEDLPRMGRLLDAVGVEYLSKAVRLGVIEVLGGEVRADLTARVRQATPFVARVLYAKEHDKFEAAVSAGLFSRLRGIEVVEVPELKLEVSLNGVQRETTTDVATSGERILVRGGARSLKSQLAAEMCRLLGATEGMTDSVALILMAEDEGEIDDFLRVRRIAPLPTDVQRLLTDWEGDAQEASADDSSADVEETQSVLETEAAVATEGEPDIQPASQPETQAVGSTTLRPSVPATQGQEPTNRIERDEGDPNSREGLATQRPSTGDSASNLPDIPVFRTASVGRSTSRGSGSTLVSRGSRQAEGGGQPDVDVASSEPSNANHASPTLQRQSPAHAEAQAPQDLLRAPMRQTLPIGNPTRGGVRQRSGRGEHHKTKQGRLLSYADSPEDARRQAEADVAAEGAARNATGQAAVDHFVATQATRWKSLTPMPHNNPGFDVKAIALDGGEEFIEVKGQSGAWTQEGIALTPRELVTAEQARERYWLCVVEYVHDESQRKLYLVRDPFGLTGQFRFDSGWKSVAQSEALSLLKPEAGVHIVIPGDGKGSILSVKRKGQFYKMHVVLESGAQVHRTYNPATMKLSAT